MNWGVVLLYYPFFIIYLQTIQAIHTMRKSATSVKEKLFKIVFKADSTAGRNFDLALIATIILSIIVVLLDSVSTINETHASQLSTLEWGLTILFSLEYIIRISIVRSPRKFIFSFYGIVDLLSCLPAYLALFTPTGSGLLILRALRLLRLFRVLKLTRYVNASSYIWEALKASRYKIGIFLYTVVMVIIVIGALMYLIEGEASGFDSIPRSMYWVVVTITTVGYGDIAPATTAGQFIASIVMILGYAIIAVPTGIVTAETARIKKANTNTKKCPRCLSINPDNAIYCYKCGEKIDTTKV